MDTFIKRKTFVPDFKIPTPAIASTHVNKRNTQVPNFVSKTPQHSTKRDNLFQLYTRREDTPKARFLNDEEPQPKWKLGMPLQVNPPSIFKPFKQVSYEDKSPWDFFRDLLNKDTKQCGPIRLAQCLGPPFHTVAIKTRLIKDKTEFATMSKYNFLKKNKNLLRLECSFFFNDIAYLVYEDARYSLQNLICIVEMIEEDIASIVREVILGIEFVHNSFKVGYGQLSLESVRIWNDGENNCQIKLGKLFIFSNI